MDKRILEVAYAEGERILKCYEKTRVWNNLPKEDKITQFDEYLKTLRVRILPSIEVIHPCREGSFPFLKLTFMSGGDRNDFISQNKKASNKYDTSYMTPRCIEGRERQIRDTLKKEVGEWLSKNGYRVVDKDLSFFPMIGYVPDFHLRYRCSSTNW